MKIAQSYMGVFLVLSGVVFGIESAGAQTDPKFEHYSTQDGLPQSVVSSIIQDKQGFIWVSTHDGIARFDGYKFKVYQHDPRDTTSLAGNWIGHMREAENGISG